MRIFYFFFSIFLLCSCGNDTRNIDSQKEKALTDTTTGKTNTEDETNLSEELIIDTSEYRLRLKIDTTVLLSGERCLISIETGFDSAKSIVVPKKYLTLVNINNFTVFEMFTHVRATIHDKVLLDTILHKSDYESDLDSTLTKFGNLMLPTIRVIKDSLEIGHSLSIPLSDVGVGVRSRFHVK